MDPALPSLLQYGENFFTTALLEMGAHNIPFVCFAIRLIEEQELPAAFAALAGWTSRPAMLGMRDVRKGPRGRTEKV